MKNNLVFRILTLVLFFGLITLEIFGQTSNGKIVGKVTDKKTGETLIGLNVKVTELSKGASTDVEGRYILSGIPAGKYTLQFTYVGYATKTISDVVVSAGTVTTLDVAMDEPAGNQLQTVVVKVSAKQESLAGLYAQQKNAVSISSGISADQIKKSPDRNTSEVLKRVSGTSIQDNKFIVIRGLSDRYNTALLNNAILPSSEPDRKAFSFDIVPSNLVDKIVINKTASPDLPGDFAGGVTQIVTKDVPDRKFLSVAVSTGYNSQSTFQNFRTNGRSSTDFLGFDNGSRDLPSAFPSKREEFNNNNTTTNQKIAYTRLVSNPYGVQQSQALPVQSYQVNYGNSKTFKNDGVFGSILSLTYRNAQTFLDAGRETYDGIGTNYLYQDDVYRYSTSWGALANFTYKKGNSKISLKNLYNQSLEDSYIDRSGYNINQGDISYSGSELNQKSLFNTQLDGTHSMGKKKSKLEWNLNYSLIKRNQPDLRNILYNYTAAGDLNVIENFSRRFFSYLDEDILGGSASYSIPFDLFAKKSTFKIGALKQVRSRAFSSRTFVYERGPDFDPGKASLPKEVIFNDENISRDGFLFNEVTNNSDSYDGYTDLNAGFLMLDNQLSDKIRLIWGVRAEDYYQDIDAIGNNSLKINAEQTFFDLLPSFNLSYSVNEKANIRLSGSRTVSRPELRELAPFVFINQEENSSTQGNPFLKRSNNTNADLRFECYPSGGQAFTASVFYKHFKNPIEQIVTGASTYSNLSFTYNNARSAYAYGFELDFRKKLNFISDAVWLENLTAGANLTLIKSEVSFQAGSGQESRTLQGQSPYLINGNLQYSSPKSGFTVSALYNKIGKRISRVGNPNIPNFYERGRDVVDFQISKKVLRNRGELKLNVGDILNQRQVTYQNFNNNLNYRANEDVEFYNYKSGTSFTLGLTYDIGFTK